MSKDDETIDALIQVAGGGVVNFTGDSDINEVGEANFYSEYIHIENLISQSVDSEDIMSRIEKLVPILAMDAYTSMKDERREEFEGWYEEKLRTGSPEAGERSSEIILAELKENHLDKYLAMTRLQQTIRDNYSSGVEDLSNIADSFGEGIGSDYIEKIRAAQLHFVGEEYGLVIKDLEGISRLPKDIQLIRAASMFEEAHAGASDEYAAVLCESGVIEDLERRLDSKDLDKGSFIEKVRTKTPHKAHGWLLQGKFYREKGDLERQRMCYEFAAEENPEITLELKGTPIRCADYGALDSIAASCWGGSVEDYVILDEIDYDSKRTIFIDGGKVEGIGLLGEGLNEIPAEIGGLVNLQKLGLRGNEISKIEGLGNLVNLREIKLRGNKISKIEGLDALVNLQKLGLSNNNISKMEGLGNLVNLREIKLRGNKISKMEGLGNLENLRELWLWGNKISKIENLDALVNLQKLGLSNNNISKMEGLDALVNLRELELEYNNISKIEGLDALVNLREIKLNCNNISKMEGLDALVNLRELWLRGNKIKYRRRENRNEKLKLNRRLVRFHQ